MKAVHVCGPAAKVIPALIDALNGDAGPPLATTIGDVVFLYNEGEPDPQLWRHELEHVYQAQRMEPRWLPSGWRLRTWWGWKRFWAAYGIEHARNGYWDNRFEREARIASGEES